MNRKGEKAGPGQSSRSLPNKTGSRSLERGIKSVRQEAMKSPSRKVKECNGRPAWSSEDGNSWETSRWSDQHWESQQTCHWNSWKHHWDDRNWYNKSDSAEGSWWDQQEPSSLRSARSDSCEYFRSGYCYWGSSCYFSHDWMQTSDAMDIDEVGDAAAAAGVVFLLCSDAAEVLGHGGTGNCDGTGPMRVRIVGDLEDLGFSEGEWDPNLGIDLCWEGRH
eukprot:Skav224302  [mRNA]  locus=scaffold772:295114:295773:+ [translate_table: standard]